MGFCQKQKFQYGDFIFISQLLNDMKYVFTGRLKKTVITSFSLLRHLDGGLVHNIKLCDFQIELSIFKMNYLKVKIG